MCGLCVRMCGEQMMAKAIGFQGRGQRRAVGTPFDAGSEVCRQCGGCMYVGPACQLRCTFVDKEKAVCGGCQNLPAPCIDQAGFKDLMCYLPVCAACEIRPR